MCRKGPSYKPIPLPPPSSLAPNCLKCRGACFLKMSTPLAYTVSSYSNFVFLSFRSAKYNAKTAIRTYVTQVQTTPFRQLPTPYSPTSTINPCWTAGIVEATPYQHTDSKEVLGAYNTAMAEIASKISSEREPPTSQLES